MKYQNCLLRAGFTLAALAVITAPSFAQQNSGPVHSTYDWSDNHVIFTGSSNIQSKVNNDQNPRYQRQQFQRNAPVVGLPGFKAPPASLSSSLSFGNAGNDGNSNDSASGIGALLANIAASINPVPVAAKKKTPPTPKGDWNLNLGPTSASIVAAGQYPAKFTFDINSNPSCTDDYVMLGENATGAASTTASGNIDMTSTPGNGKFLIVGAVTYNFVSSTGFSAPGTAGTCTVYQGNVTPIATAYTDLVSAIEGSPAGSNTTYLCASGAAPNSTVTVTSAVSPNIAVSSVTPGAAGNFTLNEGSSSAFTFTPTTCCSNGADGQPSVVGINNLYSGPANAATVTGTFTSSSPPTGSVTINNTNAGGVSTTFNGAPAAAASVSGTFTGCASGCGTITVGNLVMTAATVGSATVASGTATVSAEPGTGGSLVITNQVNGDTLTITNAGTNATKTGTFTGGGSSTITIGNVVFSLGTLSTQTVTLGIITANSLTSGDTVTIAGTAYRFESSPSQVNDVQLNTTANSQSVANTNAANLAAAINNDSSLCGTTAPCFFTGAATNANVAASVSTNVVTLGNRTTSTVTLTKSSVNTSAITVSGAGSIAASAATSCGATTGTYLGFANPTQEAAAFAALINTCASLTVGVTATNSVGVITVTTIVPGSITLSEGSSGFGWTGGNGTVGTNGSASCTGSGTYTAAFVASPLSLSGVATNIASVIASTCVTAVRTNLGIAAPSAAGTTITVNAPTGSGYAGDLVALSGSLLTPASATAVSWNSATLTGGASTTGGCSSLTAGVYTPSTATSGATMATNFVTALTDSSCGPAKTAVGISTPTRATAVITVTASTSGAAGNSITVSQSATGFTWNGGATQLSGGFPTGAATDFIITGTSTTDVGALQTAINANLTNLGIASTSVSGSKITLTANSGFNGNNILVSDTLTDFSWNYGSLTGGTDTGGCTGPTVAWSYISSTNKGVVATSPILSPDGTKVAFIESTSGGSYLRVIRMKTDGSGNPSADGTIVSPTSLATTNTGWTSGADGGVLCSVNPGTTACMVSFKYSTNTNTTSAPFYDYSGGDTLYVGDSGHILWKISGVFTGTPTNVWASGVTITGAGALTGPVVDFGTHNIFVGDASGGMSYVRDTGSTVGTCSIPCFGARTLGNAAFDHMFDPPIVDSTNGYVNFFGCGCNSGGAGAGVEQWDVTPPAGKTLLGTETPVLAQTGGTQNEIRAGTFDNLYFTNSGTGNLYVCGNSNQLQQLWIIPMVSGAITSPPSNPTFALSTTTSQTGVCAPLSEIYNGTRDWLFIGVPVDCSTFGGLFSVTGGCVESFDITSPLTSSSTAVAEASASGGTSGIVVDNVSAEGHASSLYYSTQSTATCTTQAGGTSSAGGCAVQLSQSGLQ